MSDELPPLTCPPDCPRSHEADGSHYDVRRPVPAVAQPAPDPLPPDPHTSCPFCGAPGRYVTADEGTSYFDPTGPTLDAQPAPDPLREAALGVVGGVNDETNGDYYDYEDIRSKWDAMPLLPGQQDEPGDTRRLLRTIERDRALLRAALAAPAAPAQPGHPVTPECGRLCAVTGHHHDVDACDGCRRLLAMGVRSGKAMEAAGHVFDELTCWCQPYRDPEDQAVIIHRSVIRA